MNERQTTLQISKALGLGKTQPELDSVDIDIFADTPLFLDPQAFHEGKGRFAEDCSRDITEFFEAVLNAAGSNDFAMGEYLLNGLREPDEIQLGLSRDLPRGRGVGGKQARQIFERIRTSKAVKSGLIQDLSDALMFVPGIGPDKVSDITTNIVRRHLISYTQNQFELYGIPIETEMPTGLLWDSIDAKWYEEFDFIPVVEGRKILLVPKRYVKFQYDFTKLGQRYYDGFIASFIRDRELKSHGKMVSFIPRKKGPPTPIVYKEDILKEVPHTKDSMAEFTDKHPEIYKRFKDSFFRHNPISLNVLMNAQGKVFQEIKFSKKSIVALQNMPTGAKYASDYQSLMVGLCHFIFYPSISNPVLERPINDSRKRIDICFDNTAERGIFSRIRQDPFLVGREVMIECKNYNHDLKNPELDQLIGRFDPRRGRFGIILCRSIEDRGNLLARCTDAFKSNQGVILVLTDADIIESLEAGPLGRMVRIEENLQRQIRGLLS